MPARRLTLLSILSISLVIAALPWAGQPALATAGWTESTDDCDSEGHCIITGAFFGTPVCSPGGLSDCTIEWGCSATATVMGQNPSGERFAPIAVRLARLPAGGSGCYIKQRLSSSTAWGDAPIVDRLRGQGISGGHLRRVFALQHVDIANDGAQFLICRVGGGMWSDGFEHTTTVTPDDTNHCSLGIDITNNR